MSVKLNYINHECSFHRNQSSADDREEEFYYTEIEVSLDLPSSPASFGGSSSNGLGMAFSPTMSHMDMARPWSQGQAANQVFY